LEEAIGQKVRSLQIAGIGVGSLGEFYYSQIEILKFIISIYQKIKNLSSFK
jgi:hypothetical protein